MKPPRLSPGFPADLPSLPCLSPRSLPSGGEAPLSPSLPSPSGGRGERGEVGAGPCSPPGFSILSPRSPAKGRGPKRGETGESPSDIEPIPFPATWSLVLARKVLGSGSYGDCLHALYRLPKGEQERARIVVDEASW